MFAEVKESLPISGDDYDAQIIREIKGDGCIGAWINLFRMLFRERALREQKQSPNGNKPMAMKHHKWRDCSKSVEVGK